jgi:hypothetical protein
VCLVGIMLHIFEHPIALFTNDLFLFMDFYFAALVGFCTCLSILKDSDNLILHLGLLGLNFVHRVVFRTGHTVLETGCFHL